MKGINISEVLHAWVAILRWCFELNEVGRELVMDCVTSREASKFRSFPKNYGMLKLSYAFLLECCKENVWFKR